MNHIKPPKTETWLTPKYIIDALGHFALDPCCPSEMPWRTAERMISPPDDGLSADWAETSEAFSTPENAAMIWLNPPFTRGQREKWMARAWSCGLGVLMLIPAATDTQAFHKYVFRPSSFRRSCHLLFIEGRLKFAMVDGGEAGASPQAMVVVGYGDEAFARINRAKLSGQIKGKVVSV